MVMVQMSSAKNGISAREIERMHGLTPETAWFVLHRLREAMKRDPLAERLAGTVVVDETWIGGIPKNKHRSDRNVRSGRYGERLSLVPKKTPVLSLVNKETGEVRSHVITKVTAKQLLGQGYQ